MIEVLVQLLSPSLSPESRFCTVPNLSIAEPDTSMLFASYGYTHPPTIPCPTTHPFCSHIPSLVSLKGAARRNLKISHHIESLSKIMPATPYMVASLSRYMTIYNAISRGTVMLVTLPDDFSPHREERSGERPIPFSFHTPECWRANQIVLN